MFSDHQKKEFNKFIPGFTMGFVRATISHPFEILKLQSQMGLKKKYNISLYKGLHLSIISNSVERGIQFYYFDNFKKNHGLFISSLYSSLISTFVTLPYNVVLLKKTILKTTYGIDKQIVLKSGLLEYNRNILGSTTFLYSYQTLKNYNIPFQISGIMSSIIVWLITYPIDNIKNQIIAKQKISYNIPFLYRGIQYPLIRSFPSSFIGFYVYESMNKYLNI
jgi:hypothetical protein